MYFYPLCKMEHMIIDGTMIHVDYNLEYERIIGDDVSNPKYRDIKFNIYVNDEHLSLFFWIDYTNQTITITSGAFHDEPLPKEVVDVIVDRLNLKGYTIH